MNWCWLTGCSGCEDCDPSFNENCSICKQLVELRHKLSQVELKAQQLTRQKGQKKPTCKDCTRMGRQISVLCDKTKQHMQKLTVSDDLQPREKDKNV